MSKLPLASVMCTILVLTVPVSTELQAKVFNLIHVKVQLRIKGGRQLSTQTSQKELGC